MRLLEYRLDWSNSSEDPALEVLPFERGHGLIKTGCTSPIERYRMTGICRCESNGSFSETNTLGFFFPTLRIFFSSWYPPPGPRSDFMRERLDFEQKGDNFLAEND